MLSAFSRLKRTSDKPEQDLGGPIKVLFVGFALYIISQLVAVLALNFIYGSDAQSIWTDFWYVFIAEAGAAWLVYALVKRRGVGLSFIGLGRRPVLNDAVKGVMGVLVCYLLLFTASILLNVLAPDFKTDQKQNLGFNNITSGTDQLLAFIALAIFPPIAEEILVRGYMFSGLRARLKFWPSALIVSLLFGLAHLQLGSGDPLVWGAAIQTFILSIVLVKLRESTGALYAGILVHFINNVIK